MFSQMSCLSLLGEILPLPYKAIFTGHVPYALIPLSSLSSSPSFPSLGVNHSFSPFPLCFFPIIASFLSVYHRMDCPWIMCVCICLAEVKPSVVFCQQRLPYLFWQLTSFQLTAVTQQMYVEVKD